MRIAILRSRDSGSVAGSGLSRSNDESDVCWALAIHGPASIGSAQAFWSKPGKKRCSSTAAAARLYGFRRHRFPSPRYTALFLTHLHSDHVVGLPDLWLTGWIMGRHVPLQVWGPTGTVDMLKGLEQAYAFDVHMRRDVDEQIPAQGAVLKGKDIGEGRGL